MCSDLTHVITVTLVVLKFLLDQNQCSHSSEADTSGLVLIEDHRVCFSWGYASLYWTVPAVHPSCPHDDQRAVIKLRDLTRAELHFTKSLMHCMVPEVEFIISNVFPPTCPCLSSHSTLIQGHILVSCSRTAKDKHGPTQSESKHPGIPNQDLLQVYIIQHSRIPFLFHFICCRGTFLSSSSVKDYVRNKKMFFTLAKSGPSTLLVTK